MSHLPLRRFVAIGSSLSTAALITLAIPPGQAHAVQVVPGYASSAHGDVVDLAAAIGGVTLTHTYLGRTDATTDSAAAPGTANVSATSANLDLGLGGKSAPVDALVATAPPTTAPVARTLVPVDLAPLVTLGALTGKVGADYGDSGCVPAIGGVRPQGSSDVNLAGLSLVGVAGLGTVASVGASTSHSTTQLVDRSGAASAVVSATTVDVGDVSLLGGAAVVHVASPAVLTAATDGTTGATSYNAPLVTVTLADNKVIDIHPTGGAVAIPVSLPGLGVSLKVAAFAPTQSGSGGSVSANLQDVVTIDLTITAATATLADVHLGVGEGTVSASAPSGGVNCLDNGKDTDGDGLTDYQEINVYHTDPNKADTDGDGLSDGQEVTTYMTDPLKADTDGGGVDDGVEVNRGSNPLDPADDNPVSSTLDTDGDGLTDYQEINVYHTDPNNPDTDGDGLSDGQEVSTYKTDPLKADTDGDGLSDGQEVSTYKTDPLKADTDGDGLSDGQEVHGPDPEYRTCHTSPVKADTDGDGLGDGAEVKGFDLTQKFLTQKAKRVRTIGFVRTNPCLKDTDGDGLTDGQEVRGVVIDQKVPSRSRTYVIGRRMTNPLVKDTDHDGLTDKQEVTGSRNGKFHHHKTDPDDWDTDLGGVSDLQEIKRGSDPANRSSSPSHPRG